MLQGRTLQAILAAVCIKLSKEGEAWEMDKMAFAYH